ncbi:hypothetical protein N7495_004709 [Penicillium taxi]|uniref:uncharacterized protein n=1 Tax=Penicillium taxi TaxID=168475 RepID=UPI0025450D92|nr:uncharacterized protein N7495_004709 [Penicillium taxi]KAJ5899965.1 hypothetical protein N7495_004709 [Penicillium taxi]
MSLVFIRKIGAHHNHSSGALNYGHYSVLLDDITMDDSTHSIYLAGTNWAEFSGKTSNDGKCSGTASSEN